MRRHILLDGLDSRPSAAGSLGGRHRIVARLLLALVMGLLANTGVRAAEEEEEVEIPKPEVVSMTTKDGLDLKATYYGGIHGKKTVPIVILHDYKENRNEFHGLATALQSLGHAVLVPDLRGHGDSTRFKARGNARVVEVDASKLRRPQDFYGIVTLDLEAVRDFLIEKNNAGELNINKLAVIGSGMGASLATNWAFVDWSYPPLATGKQGQDIKALVLLSPEWSYRGMSLQKALAHPGVRSQVSMLIFVGADNSRAVRDAQQIHKVLEPHHPDDDPQKKSLFLLELPTNLQGTQLIGLPTLKLPATIAQFIDLRLVQQDFAWSERGRP